ncbi:MAG: DUF4097 family beta strand repeat protein [Clostridia bacterium]|nr:DUF4097 family beta strand repeat protein [Clostridia bacterium]
MRPRSIISLIIAAVFILGGIITCAVASAKANADGVMLFPEADDNGNLVYRMELDGTSKITVDAADADITVVGGAESSMIEVVNFNANYYKLAKSNGSVTFAQVDDFMSMFKFWDNGFSFKGMRYILRFGDDAPGGKKVIISLSDEDDIRLVNLSTDTGEITLENCGFAADYTVKAENGKATLKNITNSSSISLFGNSAEITAEDCSTEKLSINCNSVNTSLSGFTAKESTVKTTDGSITVNGCSMDSMNLTTVSGGISLTSCKYAEASLVTESGKVSLDFESTDNLAANVTTKNGKISVNGEFKESFAVNPAVPDKKISITTSGGDVYITHP